jgi:putative spermidine/putrescine transport system ATP-binding protein
MTAPPRRPAVRARPELASATGVPVELRGVSKIFDVDNERITALDNLDLAARAGEFLTLLGPSGSGKTTALQIIAGLQQQTAGEVWLGDQEVGRLAAHKRDVGVVFQSYALFPHMTVAQNVAFPLRLRKLAREERAKLVQEALDLVQLGAFGSRRPAQLSGGQQQRVAIARALVFRPRLLLMDEPLGALDKRLRDHMQFELRKLQKRVGITCIYVTHDQEEAMLLSDRIAILNDGRLQQTGVASEIYHNPANEFVGDFVGRMNLWDGRIIEADGAGSVIELPGGVHVRSARRAQAGARVRLASRPETLKLTSHPPAEPTDAASVVPIRVHSVRFTGANTLVQGIADGGLEILVQMDSEPLELERDQAWVVFQPDSTLFFESDLAS